jgi:hypothetical protein
LHTRMREKKKCERNKHEKRRNIVEMLPFPTRNLRDIKTHLHTAPI